MSETRKAGSEEFKRELDRAGRNYAARERIANDPERAAERLKAVDRDKYDVAGYSDKEIVMAFQGDEFSENDYFRLTGKGPGGGDDGSAQPGDKEKAPVGDDAPVVITPPDNSDDGEISIPVTPDVPIGESTKSFLAQYIKDSFNAKGGTLTNTGNITSQGNVTLDNSVTNSNKVNQIASQGYRLNLGELNL